MFCIFDESFGCDPHTLTFVEDGEILLLMFEEWSEPWLLTRVDERRAEPTRAGLGQRSE